jgi:hypothetical protein
VKCSIISLFDGICKLPLLPTTHTLAFQSYQEGPFFTGKLASLPKHEAIVTPMMLHMAQKVGTEP